MKIIKEMKIKVTSEITDKDLYGTSSETPEITHENAEAFLHLSDEGMLITYSAEGDGARALTDIEINGNTVTVKKSGAISSCLVFEEGVTHNSVYSVGNYSFDTSVTAKKIRQGIDCHGGNLTLFYGMNIGGAEKSVRMKIVLTEK